LFVSSPFNVQHVHHVAVDAGSISGLRGLPPEWEQALKESGITTEEVREHPGPVLDALQMHMQGPPPRLPSRKSFDREISAAALLSSDDPSELFAGVRKLGEGAGGVVYLAEHKGAEGTGGGEGTTQVAIKTAPLSQIAALKNEIALQHLSSHPNVVKYFNSYVHRPSERLWIAMEYVHGGTLTEVIGPTIKIPESHIAFVCKELLQALAYMHRKHRLHRDLKSDNILCGFDGSVKIADFGFAAGLTQEQQRRKSAVGTVFWMAPELVSAEKSGAGYGLLVDVWALGIILLELADGEPPHLHVAPVRALMLIVTQPPPSLQKPEAWSPEFRHFLGKCLHKDPAKRSSSEQLLLHPFLHKACEKDEWSKFATAILRARGKR